MKLKVILLGMIVFAGVVTSMFFFMADSYNEWGAHMDPNTTALYQNINATLEPTQQIGMRMSSAAQNSTSSAIWNTILSVGDVIKMPFQMIPIVTNATTTSTEAVGGIPYWVSGIAIAVIVIMITFAVLSAALRREV